jgi:DNA-binding transcriptional ArsR family regulator
MDTGTELFEEVGEPTRASILRTLARSHGETPRNPGLSFSELCERVGHGDSGNFSYHLDRLRGRFVEETDGGYVLTLAGLRVVGALVAAGPAVEDVDEESEPVGDACPICGGELVAGYEERFFRVSCSSDHYFPSTLLPPASAEGRSTEALIELATKTTRNDVELLRQEACPHCYGTVEFSILEEPVPDSPVSYRYRSACARCGMAYGGPVAIAVLGDPDVVAYFAGREVDATTEPYWRFDVWSDDAVTVESEDPLRLNVAVIHDVGRIDVTVDDDGAVLSADPEPES